MQDLSNISDNIETAPMKSYFKRLFIMLKVTSGNLKEN